MDEQFILVGARTPLPPPPRKIPWYEGKPMCSLAVLLMILLGCLGCELFIPKDPWAGTSFP